jgi:hypothetical protein
MDYLITAKLDNKARPGIPDRALYLTETKSGAIAHNNKNFGNFLWGAGASRLGFSEGVAKMGAHYNNYFKDPVHKVQIPVKFTTADRSKCTTLG